MNCAKIGMRFLQVLHLKGSELLCIFDIKHVQMFDSSILELSILEGQSPSRSSSMLVQETLHRKWLAIPPHRQIPGAKTCFLGQGPRGKLTAYPTLWNTQVIHPLLAKGHLMGSYGGFGGKRILVNPFSSGFPRSCVLKTKSEQILGTSQYR